MAKKRIFIFATFAMIAIMSSASAQRFELEPATFEDLLLEPESNWHANTDDPQYSEGEFASGYFSFNNIYNSAWDYWSCFAYANHKSNEFANYITDQYKNVVGGGHNSDNYCIGFIDIYMGTNQVWVYGNDEGDTLKGLWITNMAWVKDAIINGDGMEGPFATGDRLTLIINGTDIEGNIISTKRVDLADYTDSDSRNHYYLDSWQWVSLEDLGNVTGITFDMETTKRNAYGATTPLYFCFDDLHTDRVISQIEAQSIPEGETYNVASHFSFNSDVAAISYKAEHPDAIIDSEGNLSVKAKNGDNLEIIISGTQRGKTEYISLPLSVTGSVGIQKSIVPDFSVVRNGNEISMSIANSSFDYIVATPDGRVIDSATNCCDNANLYIYNSGIYLITLISGNKKETFKIML